MKIQIIAKRRVSTPKPSPLGGWFRSVFYTIEKCIVDGKDIPNVTLAEICSSGGIETVYGSRHPPPRPEPTVLELSIDGALQTYEVLNYDGKEENDIRTLNLEVKQIKHR